MNRTDALKVARLATRARHYAVTLCQDFETKEYSVVTMNRASMRRRYETLADARFDMEETN